MSLNLRLDCLPNKKTSQASHHMHMSEANQIMEALSTNDANMKIREGWKLLSVVVTTHPNGQLHPCYILGKGQSDDDPSAAE
ncbi:hypothetical protein PS645_03373 [Pseudomonas fluorescens]|uniref:Uncharacterized protein n=1 Tax=Pseudomonas fluorescens TaxID=294 RepID=A0A5E6UA42_PSEFL|nr:hypothetical protein [Pseudomonas fluorescens]VVN02665.1 hypothetical protein PS645_03373 [Pseudomonas fluorescens]